MLSRAEQEALVQLKALTGLDFKGGFRAVSGRTIARAAATRQLAAKPPLAPRTGLPQPHVVHHGPFRGVLRCLGGRQLARLGCRRTPGTSGRRYPLVRKGKRCPNYMTSSGTVTVGPAFCDAWRGSPRRGSEQQHNQAVAAPRSQVPQD